MSWWSTLIGGAFGFMIGGPIGAMIGATIGSSLGGAGRRHGAGPRSGQRRFERASRAGNGRYDDGSRYGYGRYGTGRGGGYRREQAQLAFFAATFSVMGHVAKADGRVSPEEIRLANRVMDQLGLDGEQRRAARALFDQGKSRGFPLDDVLDQLRSECLRGTNIRRMFLEIQFQAALADGDAAFRASARLLRRVALRLGLSEADFIQLERMMNSGLRSVADGPSLDDAYDTLGVSSDAPDEEVKRAYRRLMSRHHPDKLAAKGLPEEMMRAATERTQQIKAAWDTVKTARAA